MRLAQERLNCDELIDTRMLSLIDWRTIVINDKLPVEALCEETMIDAALMLSEIG